MDRRRWMLAVAKSDEPVKTYNEIVEEVESAMAPNTSSIDMDNNPLKDWYRAE